MGKPGADRRGHGLFDEIDLAGARAIGRVLHGALFHRRDFAGHADDDARMHQHAAVVRLLNEIRQHFFGDFEVGDDAVLHRLDGHHVARRAAEHFLGFAADGDDFAADFVDGDDRGLVDDDAFAVGEDQGVRRSQIDRQVGRKQTEHRPHVVTVLVHPLSPFTSRSASSRGWHALRSAPENMGSQQPFIVSEVSGARKKPHFAKLIWGRRSSPAASQYRHGGSARQSRWSARRDRAAQ